MKYLAFTFFLIFASTLIAQDEDLIYNGEDLGFSIRKVDEVSIDYEGKIIEAYSWKDKSGENRLVLTHTNLLVQKKENPEDEYEDTPYAKYIYAYHYRVGEGGRKALVRRIRDFVLDCRFDLKAEFIPGSLGFTDLDADGLVEICFQYRLACRSDVSPASQKLMLLEDGEKYALRGTSVLGMVPENQRDAYDSSMGNCRPDPAFENAPAKFLNYSTGQWNKFKMEMKF